MARNQFIAMATAFLSDLMKEYWEPRAESRQELQFLNAQKMGNMKQRLKESRMYFLLSCGILRKRWTVVNSRERL